MGLSEQDTLENIGNKNLFDVLQVFRDQGACSLAELTENTDGGLTTVKMCFAGEVGFINDLRKNIMGISYPGKIVRNAVVFLNSEVIIFYK